MLLRERMRKNIIPKIRHGDVRTHKSLKLVGQIESGFPKINAILEPEIEHKIK